MSDGQNSYAILTHPYRRLQPLQPTTHEIRRLGRRPGSAIVWRVGHRVPAAAGVATLRNRPGGLALLVILPGTEDVLSGAEFGLVLQGLRPQGILPHHTLLDPLDLAQVLRRPPLDLPGEVTDYVRWRGLTVDRETLRVLRRILDLAGELRSISAVARTMYVSRRALGRRLSTQGLPVPSHWLQMGRIIRAAIRLQNSKATVASIAYEHGYPDGFSLSNQMERLTGYRPREVRCRLGWEWIVEAWLRREADAGRLATTVTATTGAESTARRDQAGRSSPHSRPKVSGR